jgi:hypothetical protein
MKTVTLTTLESSKVPMGFRPHLGPFPEPCHALSCVSSSRQRCSWPLGVFRPWYEGREERIRVRRRYPISLRIQPVALDKHLGCGHIAVIF